MTTITDIPESVLQLPEVYEVPLKMETDNGIPDIAGLKGQQKTAFDRMCQYIDNQLDCRMQLLEGYAGTGKTHTVVQLIKYIITLKHLKIAVTAPTNKAVRVLKTTANYKHNLLIYKTIHSLLGLKEEIDYNGKQSFVQEFGAECDIDEIDILIIDETSMLPDELFEMINPYVERGLKIIFMGDPVQIPPVNKIDCIPFIEKYRNLYKIEKLELTDIIRQKEGNPVLELATVIRTDVTTPMLDFEYVTQHNDKGGIIMINPATDKQRLYELCGLYFSNMRFQLDSDFMKVIAWTNKTVDFMNVKIRNMIYKKELAELHVNSEKAELPKLMIGEKLIADKPIVEKDDLDPKRIKVLFTTNDEFSVDSFEVDMVNVFNNYVVKVYKTKVTALDENGKPYSKQINIVHEDGESVMNEVLKIMKDRAIKERDNIQRKQYWRNFYSVSNKFAQVKYNYAITAHKSQGSTYDNVVVIDADIDKNPRVVERNRIKYVAYTRTRTNLFIVK